MSLAAAAPIIGSALDSISGVGSGLFNINQAKKNRAFQERMYNKQVEDNIRLWRMQNEYNLPSAVRQRLEDAGLNPLLMYEGGTTATTSSAPASGNAPSGDSARGDFRTSFGAALLQSSLINAQIRNINADTEQKFAAAEQSHASAENTAFDTLFRRLTKDIDIALKNGNLENLTAATNNLAANTLNTNEMTFQNALTMRQARMYEVKRFDLDFNTIGTQLEQGWKQIANDTQRVKQGWRDLALRWMSLQNEIRWTNEQIGALRWNVLKDKALFTPTFEGLSLDNKLKKWDTLLKLSEFNESQVRTFNMMLKNYYLQNTGQEQVSGTNIPALLWQGTHKPKLQDMFLIPKLHL